MPLQTRRARRVAGALLVLALPLSSVLALRRGLDRPVPEDAPDFRQKGSGDKIVVVEFSDFQCPHCRLAKDWVESFMALYGKDTRFVFKYFPLERIHPWARQAALMAECAGRQGRFWQAHDAFYQHQADWSEAPLPDAALLKYAKETGVDESKLKQCLSDPSVAKAVDQDAQEAKDRWVYSTPTFFVNGKRFVGRQFSMLAPIWIDKHVKR